MIAPEVKGLLARFDEPTPYQTFVRLQSECLFGATSTQLHAGPFFDVFFHPLAGLHVLATLTAAGEGPLFPTPAPTQVSLSATARLAGVNSTQIKRVLSGALAAGMLVQHSGGGYTLSEQAAQAVRFNYASQLINLLIPAARTLRVLDPR